jgi:hypothetical protein
MGARKKSPRGIAIHLRVFPHRAVIRRERIARGRFAATPRLLRAANLRGAFRRL